MEFPFGHHHHHHNHRPSSGDGDEDGPGRYPPPGTAVPRPFYGQHPPPPPPSYGGDFYQPPPPSYPPPMTAYPPQQFATEHYPPYQTHQQPTTEHYPPYQTHQQPAVQHVAHETPTPAPQTHHSYYPHLPSFPHHHTQPQSGAGTVVPSELANKATFKVYCKADPDFALTIRDEKVVLARANPNDPYQHWYKDEKYSTRVKDEEGFPCFALVNKATGLAMKHSYGASHPVQLIPYSSDRLDESIQWTMSKDLGGGYRTIRMGRTSSGRSPHIR
ncbi:hypothetical protein MLD38_004577 [Melastoma candidum]|uniref:Uncharacterized protein n=1 Tax=Melastoma candidum TaxID=119954 RepID=A0ACB9SEQ4_9MYRT|nr:hypothetical protein MLD38_004577 [Melastoma candidum]